MRPCIQAAASSLRNLGVLCVSALFFFFALHSSSKPLARTQQEAASFRGDSQEEADRKSAGCISCHTSTDEATMHPTKTVRLGCTDCHGGNSSIAITSGIAPNSPEYDSAKEKAHVQPRNAVFKNRSNLPERVYTLWLKESAEYIRFVNPGDLRVAPETCGTLGCHAAETRAISTSMMTHAGFLWGAALYNNGEYPAKNTRFGESYNREGLPQSIKTSPRPTTEETRTKGVIPELDPLYRWEISQPGNVLRVFERGGRKKAEIGNPRREEDPIKHAFTRSIPSSQCMICHIHPGTNMVATYFGLTWWDNEIDGDKMYPKEQRNPTEEQRYQSFLRNPEGAAARGLWDDEKFLENTGSAEFNKQLKTTQFADFHGHGWVFRFVFNHDRKGNWLDKDGKPIAFDDPDRFRKAVHLADIHLEKGMQCNDCHFAQDNHGNGKIYGEPRAAVEIDCTDCHGTIRKKATLVTSGPAAPESPTPGGERGRHLGALRTPWGLRRFEWRDDKLYQRSMSEEDKEWEIVQTIDTITPANVHFNMKSLRAKLLNKDGIVPSQIPADDASLAHANSSMTCYSCHTSWTPTCLGCHLQMTANARKPMLHNEGLPTKNYTSYNFQVLRDDIYMLGVDGTVTGHRIAPARSSCAVLVSSQNANREWLYYTQQTISAPGFSGQAFSTFVPHTVRARETKQCSDCHVSTQNDNNAWMAQLLLQGTNFMNFMGRHIYVATGNKGFEAVAVAEHDEPEAVYGSDLQRIAYPDNYKTFVDHGRQLHAAAEHSGNVLDIQARGEYAYAANGTGGLRIYDIANIDNKGFSEKITTSPVSPIGQRFFVPTKNALAVSLSPTLA